MNKPRWEIDAALNAKIALESLQDHATASGAAVRDEDHRNHIGSWKKQMLDNAARVFATGVGINPGETWERQVEEPSAEIGQRMVERGIWPSGRGDKHTGPHNAVLCPKVRMRNSRREVSNTD